MTALNPVQTIGEQVAETILIHGAMGRSEARSRAAEVLERVGLPNDRFPLSRCDRNGDCTTAQVANRG